MIMEIRVVIDSMIIARNKMIRTTVNVSLLINVSNFYTRILAANELLHTGIGIPGQFTGGAPQLLLS